MDNRCLHASASPDDVQITDRPLAARRHHREVQIHLSALALGLSLTLAGVSGCSAGDGMSVKGSSGARFSRKGTSLNLDELRGFDNVTVTLDDVTTGADCAAKASTVSGLLSASPSRTTAAPPRRASPWASGPPWTWWHQDRGAHDG